MWNIIIKYISDCDDDVFDNIIQNKLRRTANVKAWLK